MTITVTVVSFVRPRVQVQCLLGAAAVACQPTDNDS